MFVNVSRKAGRVASVSPHYERITKMNKIDELIAKYCPNGVEYRTLGEVCDNSIK